MNIWILNHYAQTPEIQGGTRHYDFASCLKEKGHNVTIFESSFHYSLLKETKNYNGEKVITENYNGIDFIWFKTIPYKVNNYKRMLNNLSFAHNLYNFAKKLKKPHIIIGSTVHPLTPFAGYKLAKKFNIPFVFEIRDLWGQTLIETGAMSEEIIYLSPETLCNILYYL